MSSESDSLTLQLVNKLSIVGSHAEAANLIDQLLATPRTIVVCFMNAHAVNLARHDARFFRDLADCDILLRDGIGLSILLRLLRVDPGLNMNGTDFIPAALQRVSGSVRGVVLAGTEEPFLSKARQMLEANGIKVIDVVDGFQEDACYINRLRERGISDAIVVLGMGMPKQERVASLIKHSFPDSNLLVLNGGAIIDFLGGKVSRAPSWMRNAGLEWLYRLALEPKRLFRRYVVGNVAFLSHSIRLALAFRRHRR